MMSYDVFLMKQKKQIENNDIENNQLLQGFYLWEEQKKELEKQREVDNSNELLISVCGNENSGRSTLALSLAKAIK